LIGLNHMACTRKNKRKGMFGAFRMADGDEEKAWEAYAAGKGPLPLSASSIYAQAAE